MRIPLWLKIAYTLWFIVWTILYARVEYTKHFLWLCHIGNFILAVAIWTEIPLLFSWQAVSLLVADLVFVIDVTGRGLLGFNPIGGTEYMFDTEFPQEKKLLALFHIFMPFLLIWTLYKFGYDRRAIWCQLATIVSVFPLSFLVGTADDNINWVYGPFGKVQHVISPLAYLFASMVLYTLVLYLPSHLIFCLLVPRPREAEPA